jgi:hypothetical protein
MRAKVSRGVDRVVGGWYDDAPFEELDSFEGQGALGGGVFCNGIYFANNWSRQTDGGAASGEVLRQGGLVSMNTGLLIAAILGPTEVPVVGN